MQITQLIVRWRWAWFGLIGLMMCLCYNGQWQLGPDSAAYRELGHQLASRKGYVFRDKSHGVPTYNDETTSRYPGLPLLLAGVEKIFGSCDWAPLLLMQIIAVLSLAVTYQLMLCYVPPWLALSVVAGLGINARFLLYANELLTEMPFLLGLVTALWGYEKLLHARSTRGAAGGLGLAFAGMLVAAVMRPAFWFLALALFVACVWGMITGRQGLKRGTEVLPRRLARLRYGALLAAMVLVGLIFLLVLDLRTKESVLGGGYEQRAWSKLSQIKKALFAPPAEETQNLARADTGSTLKNLTNMCETELPVAFFGTRLGPKFVHIWVGQGDDRVDCGFGLGTLVSLLIVGFGIALGRRNIAWGLLVLVTAMALAIWGAIPRYFIMLLPLLLAGWGLMVEWTALHARRAAQAIMCIGLGAVVLCNLGVALNLARVQRGLSIPFTRKPLRWCGFHHVGFLAAYQDGKWAKVVELGQMLRRLPLAYDKMIGPESSVLTYLSGRQVYPPAAAVPNEGDENTPAIRLGLFPVPDHWKAVPEYDSYLDYLRQEGRVIPQRELKAVHHGREVKLVHQEGGYCLRQMTVIPWPARPERHNREVDDSGEPRGRGSWRQRVEDQDDTAPTTQTTQPAQP